MQSEAEALPNKRSAKHIDPKKSLYRNKRQRYLMEIADRVGEVASVLQKSLENPNERALGQAIELLREEFSDLHEDVVEHFHRLWVKKHMEATLFCKISRQQRAAMVEKAQNKIMLD